MAGWWERAVPRMVVPERPQPMRNTGRSSDAERSLNIAEGLQPLVELRILAAGGLVSRRRGAEGCQPEPDDVPPAARVGRDRERQTPAAGAERPERRVTGGDVRQERAPAPARETGEP